MEQGFEQGEGRLLTPVAFQAELIVLFERYRTGRKPESLQTKTDLPPMAPAKAVVDEIKQSPGKAASSLWERFTTTVKNTASDLSENMATHNALTKFVEDQMVQIIAKRSSPLKKMTDLAILFHGLFLFISDFTHSTNLLALLTEFNDMLWDGTPLDASGEKKDLKFFKKRFYAQIGNAAFLCANKGVSSEYETWEQIYECVEPGEPGLVLKSLRASVVMIWPDAWMGDAYAEFLASDVSVHNLAKVVVNPINPDNSNHAQPVVQQVGRSELSNSQHRLFRSADAGGELNERTLERLERLDPEIEAEYKRLRGLHEQALLDLEQSHQETRELRDVLAQVKGMLSTFSDEKFLIEQTAAARVILSNVRGLLHGALEPEPKNKLDL